MMMMYGIDWNKMKWLILENLFSWESFRERFFKRKFSVENYHDYLIGKKIFIEFPILSFEKYQFFLRLLQYWLKLKTKIEYIYEIWSLYLSKIQKRNEINFQIIISFLVHRFIWFPLGYFQKKEISEKLWKIYQS